MEGAPPRFGSGPAVATADCSEVVLTRSRLFVEVRVDRGLVFLDIRSRLDPTQSFLVSLGHRPVLSGLTSFTRVGGLHALYWGLAFGVGAVPDDAVVRFESGTLRHPHSARSAVRRLSGECWVADAPGVFARATLLAGKRETASSRLTGHP